MKKFLLEVSMYISSFIPLYFLIIVKELTEILNGNLTFDITNTIMLSLNFVLILIGILGITLNFNNKEFEKIEIVEYKNITCQNFFAYFPIFVLFALAFELEYISMAIVYILILIMLGIVYIKNNLFYINPFLNIIGFSTYEITYKIKDETVNKKHLFLFKKINSQNLIANNYFLKKGKNNQKT